MLQNQTKEEKRHRRVSEEQLRTTKCYKCIHCKDEDDMRKMSFMKSLCGITGRWGSQKRAYWCLDFETPNYTSDTTEYHGHRIRNRQYEAWRAANYDVQRLYVCRRQQSSWTVRVLSPRTSRKKTILKTVSYGKETDY